MFPMFLENIGVVFKTAFESEPFFLEDLRGHDHDMTKF